MPTLNEGSILYMPTTLPGISVAQAEELLQTQDRVLKSFPEVERVMGKAGRAETSTDPAPFSMMETTVVLKPESEWRPVERWYSSRRLPEWFKAWARTVWRDRITYEALIDEMDRALQIPGQTNAWTMPIKARIDMLTTGDSDAGRHQGVRIRPGGDPADRRGDRAADSADARHEERVRRAGDRRPLRGLHAAAGPAGALRPHDRPGADGDHERRRRREHHDDGRRTRALPGEPALSARTARRHRPAAARARAGGGRRPDPARRSWPTSSWSTARR